MKFSTIITYLTLQTFTYINDSSAAEGDANRFIVKFKDRSRVTGPVRGHRPGSKTVKVLPDDNMEVMYFSKKEYEVKYWEQQEDVEYVVLDHKVYLSAESVPYGITAVQALKVSDDAVSNQKVCIIDTGYDITHPDLQDETSIVSGTSQITLQSWTEDGDGHGTHVAGTIAAIGGNDQGVVGVIRNGEVKLHIVKIFDNDGDWAYSSNLIEAVTNCAAEGSTVVNMSLGCNDCFSQAEDDAFTRIYNQGVLLVAAAGNAGTGKKAYPASYSSVMSVAAVDQNNDRAGFSQFNDEVDIAAPGVDILSTIPWGYAKMDGTSMACPAVAGVAALVWSHFPTKSAQEIRDALESTAEDLGQRGRDDEFGHGLVQAHRAYNCLAGGDCSSGIDDLSFSYEYPEDLSFSYEYPEDLSFSYDYPTMAPVPVSSSPSVESPYCPSSILEERTFYAHGPALPYCFKIELFPGGRLIADMDDPTCSEEVFTESLTVSTFQGFSENQVNWGAPGDAFGGISKFLESDDVTEPALVINYSSFISGVFDVEIKLPTCSFPYCPSSDIADTIIYAHGPAVDACFKMELYPGGGLIADTTDPTCSNPKEDFTESVTYSTFQGFSGNQAIWGAAAPGGFSGTFEFLESDDITKPALVVNDFDDVSSVFDVGIELSTCSSPYCPKSEIEGRNIKVIGPAPGRFCLIMELYLGGRLIIDTTNQDCQNNEFTESATLSTFYGFNGRQVVWGSPGSYSGTFDFVESDEVVGPELVLNGFDSGVFDVEIKLPTCAV